jgi:DNA-3-methyladenine glycosylase II
VNVAAGRSADATPVVPPFWNAAKRALVRRDDVLAALVPAFPRIALRSRGDAFQTLARSIVGQQISVSAAASVWNRLLAAAPRLAPEAVLALAPERLRACGLSGRKVEYVRDLAQRFADGAIHVHRWPEMDDEAIIDELVRVRGIGRWTAEMFLMFSLLRPDVLPVDDLGLQRAVAIHYFFVDDRAPAPVIRDVAERWRPWRSVATWYLWRSLEPLPVEY